MICHNDVAIFCFKPPPSLVSAVCLDITGPFILLPVASFRRIFHGWVCQRELGVIPPRSLASVYPDCLPVWIHLRDFHVRLTVIWVLSLLILMGYRGLRSRPVSLVRFSCLVCV